MALLAKKHLGLGKEREAMKRIKSSKRCRCWGNGDCCSCSFHNWQILSLSWHISIMISVGWHSNMSWSFKKWKYFLTRQELWRRVTGNMERCRIHQVLECDKCQCLHQAGHLVWAFLWLWMSVTNIVFTNQKNENLSSRNVVVQWQCVVRNRSTPLSLDYEYPLCKIYNSK